MIYYKKTVEVTVNGKTVKTTETKTDADNNKETDKIFNEADEIFKETNQIFKEVDNIFSKIGNLFTHIKR